ncbi:MAG TPA: SDR family oxidoreductase [Gemmatimonadaceae bacterium]|nr:SDR family oxidoreductase [Gemmatimonadaceae bacterium]
MPFSNALIALTGVGREGQVGEVVAQAFADRGAELALLDVNADGVRARAAAIVARGGRARAYPCDLTDADAVRRVAEEIAATAAADGGRGVRALVNLAGGFAMSGPVADSDVAVLHRQIAINLTTAYCATRAFLPALRAGAAGDGALTRGDASIVFFASAAALPGASIASMSAYAAAKSGVLALMRAVAEEERDHGVRANALAPTAIRTGDNLRAMGADAGDGGGVRYVERESVADAVLFLCSPEARNVTGQVLKLE